MFASESIAIAYFLLLSLGALFTRATRGRKSLAVLLSISIVIGISIASRTLPGDARAWLPHMYLALGYWIPSMLVRWSGESSFETWLQRSDQTWREYVAGFPPWAETAVELSYLMCYAVVPLGFVVVWIQGSAEAVQRFWVSVLLSGYACYFTLPWLISRPPRSLPGSGLRRRAIASMNVLVLRGVSHQLNTFPSGHVAVAVAAALAVLPVWRMAGVMMGILAAGIAIGAAVGRYHYGLDVLTGAIVGIVAVLASSLFV